MNDIAALLYLLLMAVVILLFLLIAGPIALMMIPVALACQLAPRRR